MEGKPQLSLVICTRNRANKLPACLEAVQKIVTNVPWELVLVDNGSTDDTSTILAAFASRLEASTRIVSEPARGLNCARNAGWRAARGEFIGFTDDDCYVAVDYFDRLLDLFREPQVGFGGGKVTLFDPNDHPGAIQLAPERFTVPPRSFIPGGLFHGANMAFRRSVLEQIGGFDPELGAGRGYYFGDVDALVRASFAGWTAVYEPRLAVAHHHGRNAKQAARLDRVYDLARGAYYAKFLIRADTRRTFAKNLYWENRHLGLKVTAWRNLARELKGAIGYLLFARSGRDKAERLRALVDDGS